MHNFAIPCRHLKTRQKTQTITSRTQNCSELWMSGSNAELSLVFWFVIIIIQLILYGYLMINIYETWNRNDNVHMKWSVPKFKWYFRCLKELQKILQTKKIKPQATFACTVNSFWHLVFFNKICTFNKWNWKILRFNRKLCSNFYVTSEHVGREVKEMCEYLLKLIPFELIVLLSFGCVLCQ